jgi:NitT/TauT family transport system permease protein
MAVAYEQRDTTAVFLGIAMMFTLIILVDRCLWAPLVVWSERFRFERPVRSAPRSLVLDWLKRSRLLESFIESGEELRSWTLEKLLVLQNKAKPSALSANSSVLWKGVKAFFILLGAVGLLFGIRGAYRILSVTHGYLWLESIQLTAFTFIRVTLAVVLGSLWTIPVGVFIGTQPKWTTRLQPVVQVVASFPAPMLFPALVFVMSKLHLSIEFGSVILMIFASQWYILFNVISGATLIPRQMMDLSAMFQVRGWTYWRSIILPAIFPSLVNGWITAAGGAWNASIVSELVQGPQGVLIATGVGSSITRAAEAGDFANLACGVVTMVTTVVLLNRFLWGYLYKLAETKFRMDY